MIYWKLNILLILFVFIFVYNSWGCYGEVIIKNELVLYVMFDLYWMEIIIYFCLSLIWSI